MEERINEIIQHEGIVQKAGKGSILVRIISVSACSGCHAEGACAMTGKEEKLINIPGNFDVTTGDKVTVIMKKTMGYRAVILGYVFPIFAVIIMLMVLNSAGFPELTSGLLSISALIPYYTLIFLFRKRIDKEFTFTLKKLKSI